MKKNKNLQKQTFHLALIDTKKKFDQIKNDIDLNGFKNAAVIHSISGTGNAGGKLGWINQNSINQKLNEKIRNLNVGEFTKPIVIPGGFLILKINDIRKLISEKRVMYDHNIDQRGYKWSGKSRLKKIDNKLLPEYLRSNLDKYKDWIDQ